jgi:hypothetical protein
MDTTERLWVLTTYFNPLGWRQRRHNYDLFRAGLPDTTRLLTVEHAPCGAPDLTERDADLMVTVTGGDVMWQKERLLNIGLARLPRDCDVVAWMDCDVVLTDPDWPRRAREALGQGVWLVQPFDQAYWLTATEGPGSACAEVKASHRRSLAAYHAAGDLDQARRQSWACPNGMSLPDGYAWVAPTDLLRTHGFYDASIIGGGTRELALAALGDLDTLRSCRPRTPAQLDHVLAWATRFAADVAGRIGVLAGTTAWHLWHGSLTDRRHGTRHHEFRQFDFIPDTDIRHTESGAWAWASNKPAMHDWVVQYLRHRAEDVAAVPAPGRAGELVAR